MILVQRGNVGEIKNRSTKAWPDWVSLWLAWTIVTTLGWGLAGLLTLGVAFAFTIPDPDAARIHMSTPLPTRLLDGLALGAVVGLVPALLIALLWKVLRRSTRDIIWAVVATIVGSALICLVGRAGGPQIESGYVTTLRLGILGGVIGGGFVGLCQWLLLRHRASSVDGWIVLTVASWAIGWTLTLWGIGAPERFGSVGPGGWTTAPMAQQTPHWARSMAAWVAAGAIVGLGQWLCLRKNVRRAGWWVLATATGWCLAAGAGVGMVTGIVLVLLLRAASHHPQQTSAEGSGLNVPRANSKPGA
jgi:hypothetical protein